MYGGLSLSCRFDAYGLESVLHNWRLDGKWCIGLDIENQLR